MLKFKAKKSLGQNFLVNDKIYHLMMKEIAPEKEEIILEVGPGTGILTEYLAETEASVIAVEKDRRLILVLKEKFKNKKNVKIIEGDILKLKFTGKSALYPLEDSRAKSRGSKVGDMADLSDLKIENPHYKIVGNIPYYLTSHLLRTVLEDWPKPKLILFMVQKEVAKRIIAKPPKMNLLALAVQFYAEAKIIKNVSKNNFRPVPKVDSVLIKIVTKKNDYPKNFQKNFFKLARAAFGNKRKQILNSLANNLKLEKSALIRTLNEAEIDAARRPESLHLEEWGKLTKLFFSESSSV